MIFAMDEFAKNMTVNFTCAAGYSESEKYTVM